MHEFNLISLMKLEKDAPIRIDANILYGKNK
jgi:hypothetical protein